MKQIIFLKNRTKRLILSLVVATFFIPGNIRCQCVQPLTKVGPQIATHNNQVFDHLQILTTTNVPAIDVGSFDGVQITNCWIDHYGKGIYGDGCNDLVIDHCVINCNSAPAAGPGIDLSSDNSTDNILVYSGANVHITNVECHDGSHNIAVGNGSVSGLVIQNVNCYNPRGKFSFGANAIVVGGAVNSTVSDFYCYLNPTVGWSEDMVSISSNSNNVKFKRGCVDGNNSPTGDGIMIEGGATGIEVDSVDVLNQGNGVIGIYSGAVATLKNIRIRGEKTGSYNVGGYVRNVPNGVCLVACTGTMGTLINCLIDKPTILNSCCGYITSCGMTNFTVAGPNWTTGSYEQITNGQFTAQGPITLTCMPIKDYVPTKTEFSESMNKNITVYPNPFITNFTIKISYKIKIKDAVLKIYDLCGKEIKNISVSSNETIIERSELQNGIYLYSIINNNENIGKGKLVIQ
ncbi:MAG: T9SS type A sorting domain-containing protein [Bacteroidales bacterium]|nr:T9SS type A sorting domain-containing protein [Bacteroidales bacterium]